MKKDEEIRKIVKEAVHETLTGLGISADKPDQMQADFIYIRKIRQGSECTARKIRASFITVTVSTFLYICWEAVKHLLKGG